MNPPVSSTRAPKMIRRSALTALAFSLGTTAGFAPVAHAAPAPAAQAPDPKADTAMAEIVSLNKKAIGEYRAGKSADAMTDLLNAAKLAVEHGFGKHDVMARTQIHLGIVAIAGLKERHRGLAHFGRALAIKPNIKLTPSLATAALKRDLRTGRKWIPQPTESAIGPEAPGETKEVASTAKPKEVALVSRPRGSDDPHEPPMPQAIPQPLYCPTPDLGPPDEPVPLFCVTQPEVKVGKVVAFFRPAGGDLYTSVPMGKKPSGWLTATVPAQAVRGGSLQVYFEAQDNTGNVAASNGKDEMPNVILLKAGAPQVNPRKLAFIEVGAPPNDEGGGGGDEATPLELRERAAEKAAAESPVLRGRPRRPVGRLFMGLGVGSGYGWHGDMALERHTARQVGTGYSPAGLGHLAPELGYQLTERLTVSLQSRHQYLPASGAGDAEVTKSAPQLAHALLLRLQYAFADFGDLQLTGSLAAGGGSALRMQVAPNTKAGIASSDTLVAGPGAAGPGLGLAYNLSKSFIIAAEARALAGFPSFAVLMEGTGSLQYTF